MSRGGTVRKKLALALVALLSLLIAGCTSIPPPPMVTKG
jgi:hypothetical protein